MPGHPGQAARDRTSPGHRGQVAAREGLLRVLSGAVRVPEAVAAEADRVVAAVAAAAEIGDADEN